MQGMSGDIYDVGGSDKCVYTFSCILQNLNYALLIIAV